MSYDIQLPGIQDLIRNSIAQCESDIQKDLCGNIILSGHSTYFPGFSDRVSMEMKGLLKGLRTKVISPPERKYSAWFGGSVVSCLCSMNERYVTKNEYEEYGPFLLHRRGGDFLKC